MTTALLKRLGALEELVKQQQQIQQPKQFRIGVFASTPNQSLLGVVDINGKPLAGTDYDTAIADKFLPLLDTKYRFVSMRGGRGSGKSVTVAKILLLQAYHKPIKVLCFREVQNSIKDSVYQNLVDLIDELGLGHFYSYTLNEIRGANGSAFIFKGLSDQTVESIKSFSGIDICWGEEAAGLTDKSLNILIPTIRNEGSRFYFTWNPSLDTDAVYHRYVLNSREDVKDIEVNYLHNPWFPSVLEVELNADKGRLSQDMFSHIWEGKVLPAQQGAVYFREISKAFEQERVTRVRVDPSLAVHSIWDLGMADQTAIILVQRTLSEIRVVGYFEDNRKTLSEYNQLLRTWGTEHQVNWGTCFLPHDARHDNIQTGQTAEEVMKAFGWKVEITPNISIDEGIRSARSLFALCYFDRESTGVLLECLKRYRYSERPDGSFGKPVHDLYSHGADAFRYLAVNQQSLTSTNLSASWGKPINYRKNSVF
ncbi:PBSX family phage terminase large subunit [Burkholderia guangdongensis]|uniref:PBSX family phage terminase large subunit n=1 Tax=Burkholderia guangdongensis TaxID=1792500 RepID=UPI0015C6E222|nr:PBSX family phage terminase large subunit [Burkholderia guangdongensis]